MRPVGKPTAITILISTGILLLHLSVFLMLLVSGIYYLLHFLEHDHFAGKSATAITGYELAITTVILLTAVLSIIEIGCIRRKWLYHQIVLNQMIHILLLLVLLGVIAIITNKLATIIQTNLDKAYSEYETVTSSKTSIDKLQTHSKCCGFSGPSDFANGTTPESCQYISSDGTIEVFKIGCYRTLLGRYEDCFDVLTPIILAASIIITVALIISYYFERLLKRRRIIL